MIKNKKTVRFNSDTIFIEKETVERCHSCDKRCKYRSKCLKCSKLVCEQSCLLPSDTCIRCE